MPGISNAIPGAIDIACPQCTHSIRIYTHGQARYLGCPNCSSFFQNKKQSLTRIQKWPDSVKPLLQLGQKAYLEKGNYVLTGIAVKNIPEYHISWFEYLFFNPVHGYVSLSENNGHWMLMEVIRDYPRELPRLSKTVVYQNKIYDLINRDNVITKYAIGEFPSKVHASIKADEFIRPPLMVARELQEDCDEWYLGKYLNSDEVLAILKTDIALPEPSGVGAAQPPKGKLTTSEVKGATGLMVVVLVVLGILLNVTRTENTLMSARYKIPGGLGTQPVSTSKLPVRVDEREKLVQKMDSVMNPKSSRITSDSNVVNDDLTLPLVSNSFEVGGSLPQNIEASFACNVDNDWFYVECYLINEATGETTMFWNDIEMYSGVDSEDGAWTEGSTEGKKMISSVKPGKYHLNVEVINNASAKKDLTITLKTGQGILSNLMICILLLTSWPAVILLRRNAFEKKRWMNSDYSPYEYE